MEEIIEKQDTRILVPQDYVALRGALKEPDRVMVDALLATGMRITEFWRFVEHPEWYKSSRHCIDLPKGSILKVKAKQKERTVILSNWGVTVVETLLKSPPKLRTKQALHSMMIRAALRGGINPKSINSKMFRKTWISWLVASGYDMGLISISSGHDVGTLKTHYLAIGFPKQDMEEIRYYTTGWRV